MIRTHTVTNSRDICPFTEFWIEPVDHLFIVRRCSMSSRDI